MFVHCGEGLCLCTVEKSSLCTVEKPNTGGVQQQQMADTPDLQVGQKGKKPKRQKDTSGVKTIDSIACLFSPKQWRLVICMFAQCIHTWLGICLVGHTMIVCLVHNGGLVMLYTMYTMYTWGVGTVVYGGLIRSRLSICLFGSQCNAMQYNGGLVMYTGFDTQPAQWERALKTASLCRAFNLLYSVHLVVHLQ